MRALVWHGKEDIRYDTVSDPEIEEPRDAIIKVTSCAICGSDLHLFHNFIPAMMPGDIMGHEMMGEVVDVGKGINGKLKKGDRIVVPFTIWCGECEQCKRGNYSVCERTNRKKDIADKVFGHTTAGLFGYTHLTGGYPGGQAEYLRVPYADTTHVKVPDSLTDEQVLFLGDIFPTGWQACSATSSRRTRSPFGAAAPSVRWRSVVPTFWGQSRSSPSIACRNASAWRRREARQRSISKQRASSTD
jgi:threonine dehydrogenase-like Zn-dependent dehydrogenase